MSYPDDLQKLISAMENEYPIIPEIISAIKRIERKSGMEYDYDIERTHELTSVVYKLLQKPQ